MFVCPKCKGRLVALRCASCSLEFPVYEGVPCLLRDLSEGGASRTLRQVYDEIYSHHENVWVDQGRSTDFLRYFSSLTQTRGNDRVLEIGCGEGLLLAELPGREKYGIDPSLQALLRAKRRSDARCAVAQAEELPFPDGCFDVIVSVGVMEHFQNVDVATGDIHRVLKPGGRYVVLVQTDMTRLQRLRVKVREYLFPRPRPLALVRWLGKKLSSNQIVQPFRKSYTMQSAADCLNRNGFAVQRIVTHRSDPQAPLGGDHVVVLLAERSASRTL
jgi:ubiquinone/menaquinone biosynthesis C-methylase UbiE